MIQAITGVWSDVMDWIVTALSSVQTVFISSTGELTFLGVLSIVSVAIGIAFLVEIANCEPAGEPA